MDKRKLDAYIDAGKEAFTQLSDQIWEYAEMRFQEYQSSALLADFLAQEGFQIQRGIAGMPTAIIASYGTGTPVIAFL